MSDKVNDVQFGDPEVWAGYEHDADYTGAASIGDKLTPQEVRPLDIEDAYDWKHGAEESTRAGSKCFVCGMMKDKDNFTATSTHGITPIRSGDETAVGAYHGNCYSDEVPQFFPIEFELEGKEGKRSGVTQGDNPQDAIRNFLADYPTSGDCGTDVAIRVPSAEIGGSSV
jgi:hypothetical protein